MVVRISWSKPGLSSARPFKSTALATASLLAPAAVIAFTVTLWAIGAELHITAKFFVAAGLLSHWQVWFFGAAALSFCAWKLNRYARGIDQNYAS